MFQGKAAVQHASGGKRCSLAGTSALRVLFVIIALNSLLLLLSPRAEAAGNIHIGQLRVHPFLSVTDTFSDNIYSTSTEEKRDSFATYTPGLQLQLPFGRHQAEAQYFAIINRYSTYKTENTTDENASGLVNFKFGSAFGLRLSDTFLKGHEPRGSSSTGFIEEFRTNAAAGSVTYQLANRSKIELGYGKSSWNFFSSPYRDRDEDLFSGYLYYRFLPKTSAFIEYDHKIVAYDPKSILNNTIYDNSVDAALAGITWEMTEKSKGTIKAGRVQKDFENKSVQDYQGWTGSLDFNHDFTSYTSLMMTGQRTVNEATVFGTRYFITTGAFAEFTFRLLGKLAGVVRGSYGVDQYSDLVPGDPAVREDRTKMSGGGLKFSVGSWLELGANYNVRERHSNLPVNDYKEHAYIVSGSAAF